MVRVSPPGRPLMLSAVLLYGFSSGGSKFYQDAYLDYIIGSTNDGKDDTKSGMASA